MAQIGSDLLQKVPNLGTFCKMYILFYGFLPDLAGGLVGKFIRTNRNDGAQDVRLLRPVFGGPRNDGRVGGWFYASLPLLDSGNETAVIFIIVPCFL